MTKSCGTGEERVAQNFADLYDSSCSANDLVAFIYSSETIDDDDEEEEVAKRRSGFFPKKVIDGGFPLLEDGTSSPFTIIANEGLSRALKLLADATESREFETFVIAAVGNRPRGSLDDLTARMPAFIAEASTSTVLVIVGVDLTPTFASAYQEICRGTKDLFYIDARDEMEMLDDMIGDVRALMVGGGKSCHIPGGITMESF